MITKVALCGFGLIKLFLYKLFFWNKISFKLRTFIFPSVSIQLGSNSKLKMNRNISIRRYCELNVRDNAEMHIGNNTFFNTGCIVTAHKKIVIGDNVEFGPNVLIFDHDHKYKHGYKAKEFECKEIVIGNNVWIGAGSIILKGSYIGDEAVVAAGSIVNGHIPENSVYIQKRQGTIHEIER